jgi:hypothetical protein
MFKIVKEKAIAFLFEIIVLCFTTIGIFMWSLHATNAAQEVEIKITKVQVEKIEEVFECFRKENREDHKEILMELRKKP